MLVNLRIVPEFAGEEHASLAARFEGAFARQLARFSGHELELSVKDRGEAGQRVTLECWVDGLDKQVTTANGRDLDRAVYEVRDDMARKLRRAADRRQQRR